MNNINTDLPTLHLIGIFHTIHNVDYSHCAFTGKALRFPKMMKQKGYKIIEYSNEGSMSEAHEKITILKKDELKKMIGHKGSSVFIGDSAVIQSAHHVEFEKRLIPELLNRVKDGDIVCHPFGHSHEDIANAMKNCFHVETGIGYNVVMKNSFKIFETNAWRHIHKERSNKNPSNYEWVIPNYYDVSDWEAGDGDGGYVAFMGRICKEKGMDTLLEIAKRIDYPVVIAGQGDIMPWRHPNITYIGPLKGKQRSRFLSRAICSIMPTSFIEPFGGSGIEGMLCGTPLVAPDWGAFTETIEDGTNGFRCKTLSDWIESIEKCKTLDRVKIREMAKQKYSLESCSEKYDSAFRLIFDLKSGGWYRTSPEIDYKLMSREAERLPWPNRPNINHIFNGPIV
jgi:glycosyltransferase involved in cell wall biosynthesis